MRNLRLRVLVLAVELRASEAGGKLHFPILRKRHDAPESYLERSARLSFRKTSDYEAWGLSQKV